MAAGNIFIGVGGWTFEPWRGSFYPDKLPQRRELEYMGSVMTGVEINGTFYGSQKPESFAKWRDEVPEGFVFAMKGTRFATNRRVLAEAGDSVARFVASGVTELKDKLGPINWQLAGTKKFDPDDFAAFLALLPKEHAGRRLRHAVEPRHESFCTPEAVALAREHGVALVGGFDSKYPGLADVTADFVYLRLQGTSEAHETGYSNADLDAWADRLLAFARGRTPADLPTFAAPAEETPRDVFAFVIAGAKERNPKAALSLIERVSKRLG